MNRLNEIRLHSTPGQWHYIPTSQNPGDFCTCFLQSPIMSNFPEARLAINQPPFTNAGIVYFGPLTIKQGRRTCSTDGTSKRYGAVFTCLSTRAVHIDLVGNLSTNNFILALC